MAYIHDIDIFGRQYSNGAAYEFFDEDAVKNALTLFLTSKRGEFLMNPSLGGYIDFTLFKNQDENSLQKIKFEIRNAITNFFTPYIQLKSVDITPDFVTRTTEFRISYYNPATRQTEEVYIFPKTLKQVSTQSSQSIAYTGENLYMFCLVQKPDMGNNKLVYDTNDLIWKWGKFSFTNYDPDTDSYAAQIIATCNG